MKEACRKAEEEICQLTDERLSLIIEVGACKEELPTFQVKATVEREAMEAEFDASSDVIFNYGYGCCAFGHDIRGSKPMILVGMPDMIEPLPPEFFINPRYPPSASSDPPNAPNVREELPKVPLECPVRPEDKFNVPTDG